MSKGCNIVITLALSCAILILVAFARLSLHRDRIDFDAWAVVFLEQVILLLLILTANNIHFIIKQFSQEKYSDLLSGSLELPRLYLKDLT